MKRNCIVYFIIGVIAILSVIRIITINSTANEYKLRKENYASAEQIDTTDFTYIVKRFRILDASQMETEYSVSDNNIADDEIYYAIVDLEYTYTGSEAIASPDIIEMDLMSDTWSNGVNMQATSQLNKSGFSVERDKSVSSTIVFNLRKDTFSKSGWKDVCNRGYQLVIMKYPNAIIIDL
ncbi:MAG: hypothetical protein PHW47_06210 [Lachnospira sp.]|nr:hypothetical protein [Lachnospira sp.]